MFYAIGNIGDSKKTDFSRLTDPSDKYECCVEIMDVELPLSDFPVDTMMNAMGYTEDSTTHEKTYTWAKDDNLGILYEKIDGEYVLTRDKTVNFSKTYYVDILEHDDFSEDYTYGWRYIYEDGIDEENAEVFNTCKQKWIDLYRFITTSTDEEFKAKLGDYFVVDSALYYYLFTTRYTMVDNRAKNSFWHYGKTGEVDSDGNPIRKWDLAWDYDNDTALGLNNYGKQVYRYGLEDTDVDETGQEVFRESDSTFFCRVRDLFASELKSMYNTLESKNAWHAESFINQADEWQSEFPEELWRLDIERKYIRTYNSSFISGKGDEQFLKNMANGKMKYHRRQWERSQEKYMASKYQSSVASSDNSVFRCSVPTGSLAVQPNYRLKLTPYAYMYLNVKYGTQSPIQLRAEPNVEYEIPFEGDKADIVDVYSSSLIQDFGDLSTCYVATADTSKASKVKQLIFGNATEGYDNPNFTTLTTGANYLLEKLNIENVSGLTQSLNLSALNNLRELYAHGSNIGGVTFADGGRIEIAELPAIGALTMKNLIYLTNLDIVDFSKLTSLTAENCNTVDLITVFNSAPNINRVRIVGVSWTLEDASLLERIYKMKGFDKNGYNTEQAVLTGSVHVPVIRQQRLNEYNAAWSDLEVTYDTLIEQYPVTFVNHDGTVLDVQYVDKGSYAVDPIERKDDPIAVPTKDSTVSTDYTFSGWDLNFETIQIFSAKTVTALFDESIREYTIKYVSKGTVLQTSSGKYGSNVVYTGDTPTYTLEESGYKYYLFNRWDKSGFIDGEKTVNAVFDSFEYKSGAFDGRELSSLSPVEVYALTKMTEPVDKELSDFGMAIETGDPFSFTMGYDIDFDDIDSNEFISERTVFDGTNYVDTGVKLFDEDKDFVLALDYKMLTGNDSGDTLMQCFQTSGTNGFKLSYNSGVKLAWGGTTVSTASVNKREMLVIRHIKGDNNLYVYTSNMSGSAPEVHTIEKSTSTQSANATLVLGAVKTDSGRFVNYGIGEINWCKVWFRDLGEDVCNQLVGWTHENIALEVDGFYRYAHHDDSDKESMMSLLATHLLETPMRWGNNNNSGGWAKSTINSFLNSRFYDAIPYQIKALMKKVRIKSTIGGGTTSAPVTGMSESGCYVTIPALYDLDKSQGAYSAEVSDYNGSISYMTGSEARKRAYPNGDYAQYWTRSPNMQYVYVWSVLADGEPYGFNTVGNEYGVLIEISF